MASNTWAGAWKRAALRHKARAREASVLATLATVTQWRAVDAEARFDALAVAARECADDLEAEIKARYSGTLDYPTMRDRMKRDMEPVTALRALLDKEAAPDA